MHTKGNTLLANMGFIACEEKIRIKNQQRFI